MKFRYFLRGVGIGIIFTSIIFMVAYDGNGKKAMSNKEIISKAKELGMVMKDDNLKTLIEESSENNSKQQSNKNTSEKDTVEKNTEKKTTEEKTTEKKSTEEKTTEKKTTEEKSTEEKTTEEKSTEENKKDYQLTVSPGSSSYPVCQKLEEMGLIDSAQKFDDYLIEHGYANRISVGTHSLKKGMTYEEIAVAISDKLQILKSIDKLRYFIKKDLLYTVSCVIIPLGKKIYTTLDFQFGADLYKFSVC